MKHEPELLGYYVTAISICYPPNLITFLLKSVLPNAVSSTLIVWELVTLPSNHTLTRKPTPDLVPTKCEEVMRRRRTALKVVKELDAFPKVEEDYQKPTARGGTISILSISIILFLVVSEFFYYTATELKYEYSVDTDLESKLLLTVDMTVAMPCDYLGADIIDLAGESVSLANHVKMEPVSFELTELQLHFLAAKRSVLSMFSESRSLNDLPIIERVSNLALPDPKTFDAALRTDSCRIHGSIEVNKIAGNFHITVGRSVPHPRGHAHINVHLPSNLLNFSHRIDHFSFGVRMPGAINPLDATLKISSDSHQLFQYFMRVVPTKFSTLDRGVMTNQYSVTERNRTINHMKGSHGIAGIFFKYDMSAMVVEIKEIRRPFWQFLIRLSGIVGGIFATSGMLNSLIGSMTDGVLNVLLRRRKLPEHATTTVASQDKAVLNSNNSHST